MRAIVMIETVCLRFRDVTGDDTVGEHSRLIELHGYCWWGWWRKTSESYWYEVLSVLETRLESGQPLQIGLFDRSQPSRFFRATATACRWALDTTLISPEPEFTPQYYRDEPVAAWFRLTVIESITEFQFKQQFGAIPRGHLTFFPVRSGGAQLTLLETAVVPIITCRMRGNTIMHLSDLHCGADFRFKPPLSSRMALADGLLRDVKQLAADEGVNVGLLVVSGDLTSHANAHALNTDDPAGYGPSALTLLEIVADGLGLREDQVVIVPGNHDIPLRDFSPLDYSHENNFKAFLSRFYHRRVAEFMQFFRCRRDDGPDVEILAINSAKLRDKTLRSYGYVRWYPYDDFLRTVGEPAPDSIRLAVLHHHLVPAAQQELPNPSYPEASISVPIDAGSVIQGLQTHGFKLVLHGHQHVPAITQVSRGIRQNGPDVGGLETKLHIVSGGSVGAMLQRLNSEMLDNCYGLLTFRENDVVVRIRNYNDRVEPHDYMRATLKL